MSYPGGRKQLVIDLASYTLDEYYDPGISGEVEPQEGYMIPVNPERRLTGSPTGGVMGRYLAKDATYHSQPPPWPYTATGGPALDSCTPKDNGNRVMAPPMRDTKHRPIRRADNRPAGIKSPADLTFVIEPDPDDVLSPCDMADLVSAHESRPGEHVLRLDAEAGQLYACIPTAPPQPPPRSARGTATDNNGNGSNNNNKNSSRSSSQDREDQGRPGCDHCASPPARILQARRLCGFHALYVATGQFPSRYVAAGMAELDAAGLGPGHGWSVEETVEFVGDLGRRLEYLLLMMGSVADEDEEWPRRIRHRRRGGVVGEGRWGAVGDGRAAGGRAGGVGRRWTAGMGPRIYQAYIEGVNPAVW